MKYQLLDWWCPTAHSAMKTLQKSSFASICETLKSSLYVTAKTYPVSRTGIFLFRRALLPPPASPFFPFKSLVSLTVAVCCWIQSAGEGNFSPAFSGSRGYTQSWLMCHSASQQLFLFTLAMAKLCADALLDALN